MFAITLLLIFDNIVINSSLKSLKKSIKIAKVAEKAAIEGAKSANAKKEAAIASGAHSIARRAAAKKVKYIKIRYAIKRILAKKNQQLKAASHANLLINSSLKSLKKINKNSKSSRKGGYRRSKKCKCKKRSSNSIRCA